MLNIARPKVNPSNATCISARFDGGGSDGRGARGGSDGGGSGICAGPCHRGVIYGMSGQRGRRNRHAPWQSIDTTQTTDLRPRGDFVPENYIIILKTL